MADPNDEGDPRIGRVVAGKYRVERALDRGGMGAVYEATHVGIGKRVALKFLEAGPGDDPAAAGRFQREAEAASRVESAHIVQIFDSGLDDGQHPYLVMELLRGEDLRARLRRESRLPLASVLHIAEQVLRALGRAHAGGIVHRDLKPGNVFLCERDDDPEFVKIVDFGISKIREARPGADTLTRRGQVLGTAYYMAPEQAQAFGEVDGRADLYSVGAILFEALTGRPPHQGSSYEAVLVSICTKDAPDVRELAPEVPEAIAHVISRALNRDREQRYATAEELAGALAAAGRGETLDETSGRGRRRSVWLAAVGAVLAALLLLLGWMVAGQRRPSGSAASPSAKIGSIETDSGHADPGKLAAKTRLVEHVDSGATSDGAERSPSADSPSAAPRRAAAPRRGPTSRPRVEPAKAPTGVASGLELNLTEP